MAIDDSELKVLGRIANASNATLLVAIGGDEEFLAIYKPVAGERPLWDFPDGTLASREYASFLISELLGWQIVPKTILREGPFGFGMVQEWITVADGIDVESFAEERDGLFGLRLRQIAIFDAIINNGDRKFGHLLPTEKGEIFGCDHGVTFHAENRLRTVLWQFIGNNFSAEELLAITRLRGSDFQGLLSPHLTGAEIAATSKRIDGLLANPIFPAPGEDWPAVPWPPF